MNPTYQSDEDHNKHENRATQYEMQEYHDFLQLVMGSSFWSEVPEPTQQAMLISRDMLCWALGHDNQAFAENMILWADAYKDQTGWQDAFNN